MSKLSDSFKENALNEDKILGRVNDLVFETQSDETKVFEKLSDDSQVYEKQADVFEVSGKRADVFEVFEKKSQRADSHPNVYEIHSSGKQRKAKAVSPRLLAYLVAAAAVVLVIGVGTLVMKFQNDSSIRERASQYATSESVAHDMAFAMISVDINPSFEIFVDAKNMVLSIDPVNEDAATLDVSALVGLPAQEAVAGIIDLAETNGFIRDEDESDDYVLVTTVLLEEENAGNQQKQDNLGQLIRERVEASGELSGTTKVAIIKATKVELFEAREKDVPMGLYVINGMIDNNGEMIPVSEFVRNNENLDKLKDRSDVVNKKDKTGDETDPASESSGTDNGPQSTNANSNATKQNETGPNENSTKPNETGANSNATKPVETNPKATETRPAETNPGAETAKQRETDPNQNSTNQDNKGGTKNG